MTIPELLKICAALYLVTILIDWLRTREFKRFLFELLPLLGLIVLDILLASASAGYVTFGPDSSSIWVAVLMFPAILLGIAARYFFYLRGEFSWIDFVKPLCISPLLLIPLIGSLQGIESFHPIQVLSLALLGFQNGFFWQVVLHRARPAR
ncbi:MAG: hypothetical protein ABSG51_12440 [Terracidiphilus sp.]|jgi:hypothetical protein